MTRFFLYYSRIFSSSIYFDYLIFNIASFLQKDACKSDRSRQEVSNEYLVAKFGFDTDELPLDIEENAVLLSFFLPRTNPLKFAKW